MLWCTSSEIFNTALQIIIAQPKPPTTMFSDTKIFKLQQKCQKQNNDCSTENTFYNIWYI